MKIRRLLTLAAVAAAATTALVSPNPAAAHYVDALHQHGWNRALMFDPETRCVGSLYYNGLGSVSVAVPDFMTTPGGTRYVYFQTALERYDGTKWVGATWDGYRWVPLGITNWFYTLANATGPVFGWRDLNTNRYAPTRISHSVQPGYYYRFRVFYFWGADGTRHEDTTNHCLV